MDREQGFFKNESEFESVFGKRFRCNFGADSMLIVHGSLDLRGDFSIEGTVILRSATIFQGVSFKESEIGEHTIIRHNSVIIDSRIGSECICGPNCFIRTDVVLGDGSIIGHCSEVARSKLGRNFKMSHFGFLGDVIVGDNVTIGAGVVLANSDGVTKFSSRIGNDCLIGCNALLIAPVDIADGSVIPGGSKFKSSSG